MYPVVPYHRGHLVPKKTYSSTPESVRSTYTYTNAVPQRPAFNSGQWSQFEKRIRKYAETCTKVLEGKLYLLTSTSFVHFQPGNPPVITHPDIKLLTGGYKSISIPNSMWTAGCCVAKDDHHNTQNFAVIGNNVEEPGQMHTQQIKVSLLEKILLDDVKHRKIGGPCSVNLFPGKYHCSEENRNANLPKLKKEEGAKK